MRKLWILALALSFSWAPIADASPAAETTIDFSTHGEGNFDQDFYKQDRVVFREGSFVGFVQGDQVLVGPISGRFGRPISCLSARVSPGNQGTATYVLSAFDASGRVLASVAVTVTQDSGDPTTGPFGYFTIDLGCLEQKAKLFTLTNVFVRSSFGFTLVEFGVSSLTFSP